MADDNRPLAPGSAPAAPPAGSASSGAAGAAAGVAASGAVYTGGDPTAGGGASSSAAVAAVVAGGVEGVVARARQGAAAGGAGTKRLSPSFARREGDDIHDDDSGGGASGDARAKRSRASEHAAPRYTSLLDDDTPFGGAAAPLVTAPLVTAPLVEAPPAATRAPPPPPPPPRTAHIPLLHGCRSVTAYRPLRKIDEGVFGVVFAAEDIETGERVALKKVKMDQVSANEGFPITALRETNVLLSLRHPNIIGVREMVVGRDLDAVYMVMEYMEHDVHSWLRAQPSHLSQAEVKCLMAQLLAGVAFMHEHWVIHRDLKPTNMLMDNAGRLTICDFGLARKYGDPVRPYTHNVVTQWYRPPELLMGEATYSTAVDMWSVGAIFAEFVIRTPLFPGRSEMDQLDTIFRMLGTPTDDDYPGWATLPAVRDMHWKPRAPSHLRAALGLGVTPYSGAPYLSSAGLDLMRGLLALNPARRLTAAEALAHPWFAELPPATDPRLMPALPSTH